ncbi:sterol desaturase family protein [Vibrio hepatarius]|uniref:sterol desaturase family protein n=1 Tax=Vibrio hepatarius TaxID=171383 RepID=UPI001C09E11E|nr:sterol desaturase family protein [Vibrio hepatarius]MBU2896627.1 sterol desaturase family protein [Vibrio hepatarius]
MLHFIIDYLIEQFSFIIVPSHGLYFVYIASAILIAIVYTYFVNERKSSFKKAVSKLYHDHTSNRVSIIDDLKVFVVDKLIFGFIYSSILGLAITIKTTTLDLITNNFNTYAMFEPTPLISVVYTVGAILVFDLGTFLEHYLAHRIRFLWEFHKVHHVPVTLNPLTAYRSHPVNQACYIIVTSSLLGLYSGLFNSFFDGQSLTITFAGQNLFMFLFLALGLNLQHSHVNIRYPRILKDIFVSPSYHQLHHSSNPVHYDKNFGFLFSFWDRLFGCQYHPNKDTKLDFGIPDEYSSYSGLYNHYVEPVRKAIRLVRICKFNEDIH